MDLQCQRSRSVFPDAGNDKDHASGKDRGQYRQYLLDVVQSRSAVHRCLLFVKRCSALTENTAYAVMRNRIRVNGLNIGWMATEGEDRIQRQHHGASPDWLKQAAAAQPFGRLVDPQEVARAVAFLSTDESGLMTGSVVNYDQSIWGAYDSSPQPTFAL